MMLGLGAAGGANAQPSVGATLEPASDAQTPPIQLGYGALPGGLHAPAAVTLPRGMMAFAALGGFGWRKDLLGPDHRFGRGTGDLAFAYAPTANLTLALSLDGRYDRHFGLPPSGDDGYVGDPRLLVRFGSGGPAAKLRFGAQLGVWIPGKDAPSVAVSAISVEARGMASLVVGPGALSLSTGFRFDNSAKSIDEPMRLSPQDRVSLGVSDYHAILGGLHYTVPAGKAFVGAEASVDAFIGSGAPGQIFRAGVHGGVHLTSTWSVLAFVVGAKVPGMLRSDVLAGDITLIPYEPIVTGGIGLQGRFGATRGAAAPSVGLVTRNEKPEAVEVIEYAEVSGQIADDSGKPIAGATVTVKLKNHTGTAVTDAEGNYAIGRLPVGKTLDGRTTLDDTGAELTVSVDGKKPTSSTLTLAKGPNPVAKLTLDPLLPPGQLRAVIRTAATGKPLANAVVTITPGDQTATTAADGTLSIDLPPGTYKATATAPGHKPQTLDVTIDPNGVALKNFELAK